MAHTTYTHTPYNNTSGAPPYKSPSGNSRTVDDSPEKMTSDLLRAIVLLILKQNNTYIGAYWCHLPLLDLVADLSCRDLAVWGVAVPARMIVHGDASAETQVEILLHLLFGFLGSLPALKLTHLII